MRKSWAQTAVAVALVAACAACIPGSADWRGSTDAPSGAVARGDADAIDDPGPDDLATGPATGRTSPPGDAATTPAATTPGAAASTPGEVATTPGDTGAGTVLRVDPWRDGSADGAKDVQDPAGSSDSCIGSVTTPRADAFRCFTANAIRDPCFADPADPSRYLCVPEEGTTWIRLVGVASTEPNPPGHPDRVFWARLANGAECKGASGAGPQGLPGYESWAGTCTGGPWETQRLIWRIADGTSQGAEFPLLPAPGDAGQWLAAVETAQGHVERLPVTTAYR